jgi:penicillin amidase
VVSWAAQAWARLLDRLDPLPEDSAERARLMLAGWDGELRGESGAALLYGCFQRALAAALYRPLLGDATWRWLVRGDLTTASVIRRWLANDTWELLGAPTGGHNDPARGERVRRVLPAVLASAWKQASEAGDPGQWRWDESHQAVAVHPLAGRPVPPAVGMGGDGDTIQVSGYGPREGTPFSVTSLSVYRQVVDMAAPEAASFVIPGGASGDPRSPHFADQLAEWARHRRVPMLSRWPDIEAAAGARTVLRPQGKDQRG